MGGGLKVLRNKQPNQSLVNTWANISWKQEQCTTFLHGWQGWAGEWEIGGHTKTQIHKLAVPTTKLMTTKKRKDVNLTKKIGQAWRIIWVSSLLCRACFSSKSCGWEAGTCVQGNLTEPTDDNYAHMVSTSSPRKSMRLMESWYNAVSSWNLVEMKAVIHQIWANACVSALLTSSQVISHCSWYTNDSSWPAEQPRSEGPSYLLVFEIFWGFWLKLLTKELILLLGPPPPSD